VLATFCIVYDHHLPRVLQLDEIPVIADLISKNSSALVRDVSFCLIDESVVQYQPSKDAKKKAEQALEPIPTVYIPRKPHPNGLELFLATTSMPHPLSSEKKMAYILDILPVCRVGDSAPLAAFRKFVDRWAFANQPHWVADAAFGSFDMMDYIEQKGGLATLSMACDNPAFLWNALSFSTPPNTWRCSSREKLMASSHTCHDSKGKIIYQQVLSNAFTAIPIPNGNLSTVPAPNQPANAESMPIFSRDALNKQTVEKLKAICVKYNIRLGKLKDDYIDRILKRSGVIEKKSDKVELMINQLKNEALPDPAPINMFYHKNFNLVDMANRRWNSVEEHHHNHQWKSKMLFAVLRFALINCWVYQAQYEWKSWKDWRKKVAQEMRRC